MTQQKVIYRIENQEHMHGMWYNHKGEFDPIIHDLCPNSAAKEFPMPYDEEHLINNKKWYSGAKSINNMHDWFTKSDAINLINNGFKFLNL